MTKIAVLMGSDSDAEALKPCGEVLKTFGVPYTTRVLSAHRTPDETVAFAKAAGKDGYRVIIAAAVMATKSQTRRRSASSASRTTLTRRKKRAMRRRSFEAKRLRPTWAEVRAARRDAAA